MTKVSHEDTMSKDLLVNLREGVNDDFTYWIWKHISNPIKMKSECKTTKNINVGIGTDLSKSNKEKK
jgi:hypothetical protein